MAGTLAQRFGLSERTVTWANSLYLYTGGKTPLNKFGEPHFVAEYW